AGPGTMGGSVSGDHCTLVTLGDAGGNTAAHPTGGCCGDPAPGYRGTTPGYRGTTPGREPGSSAVPLSRTVWRIAGGGKDIAGWRVLYGHLAGPGTEQGERPHSLESEVIGGERRCGQPFCMAMLMLLKWLSLRSR